MAASSRSNNNVKVAQSSFSCPTYMVDIVVYRMQQLMENVGMQNN
jgi:hypothetical protein